MSMGLGLGLGLGLSDQLLMEAFSVAIVMHIALATGGMLDLLVEPHLRKARVVRRSTPYLGFLDVCLIIIWAAPPGVPWLAC